MNEAPESLGIIRPTISYDLIRKTAAKVVFLGESGVGKSSILAFLQNGYTTDKVKQRATMMSAPIGEISLKVDGGSVRLNLWDTCGHEQFRTFTTSFFRGAHGAVLVYDATRKETLTKLFEGRITTGLSGPAVPSWLDQFMDHFNPSVSEAHIAVLGNKADLQPKVSAEEAQRIIDCAMKARGVEYLFYETSALTGQNLDEFAKQFASKFEGYHTPAIEGIVLPPPEPTSEDQSQSESSTRWWHRWIPWSC